MSTSTLSALDADSVERRKGEATPYIFAVWSTANHPVAGVLRGGWFVAGWPPRFHRTRQLATGGWGAQGCAPVTSRGSGAYGVGAVRSRPRSPTTKGIGVYVFRDERQSALAEVTELLAYVRVILREARSELSDDDRRDLSRRARQMVANACAGVDWDLLHRLNPVDSEVLDALVKLEPEPGEEFRTTGLEILEHTPSVSYNVVYVALRRLDYLGLIERHSGPGKQGTLVRVLRPKVAA